jgi:GNAT superfamily N-acetyltransferase
VNAIRDAQPDDCPSLSLLAFISKAYWGYDDAFMEACRDELTVRPEDLERGRVRVFDDGELVGFHGVIEGELQWMFVAPAAIGCGIGVLLWADAVEVARTLGVEVLRIEADPNAAGFYERMGAVRVGDTPSASIPGRELPVYEFAVSSKRE